MQLCDKDIYEALLSGNLIFLGINEKYPFVYNKQVQPAAVDLRLGSRFVRFNRNVECFDIKNIKEIEKYLEAEEVNEGEKIIVKPNEVIYGQVYEQMYIGDQFSARIEGRSRVARLGISVHCTGDYINPGFMGVMPLQIVNHNFFPIVLYPYIGICQIMIYQLTGTPVVKYGEIGNYNNEKVPGMPIISSDPLEGIRFDNTIKEKNIQNKIELLIQEYNRSNNKGIVIKEYEKSKIIQNYIWAINGDVIMRDQYNAEQVGNQGNKAGKNSTNMLHYQKNTENYIEYQQMKMELDQIRNYIKKCGQFNEDDADLIVGNLVQAKKAIDNNDKKKIRDILGKCGKEIYEIAKNIGCSLVVKYISSQLGLL